VRRSPCFSALSLLSVPRVANNISIRLGSFPLSYPYWISRYSLAFANLILDLIHTAINYGSHKRIQQPRWGGKWISIPKKLPQRATSTACYPVYKYISNTLDAIRSKAWLYLDLAKRVHIGNSKPRNSFGRTRRPRTNRRQANAQLRHDGRRTLIGANLNGKNVRFGRWENRHNLEYPL